MAISRLSILRAPSASVDIDGRPGKVKRFGVLFLHISFFYRFFGLSNLSAERGTD